MKKENNDDADDILEEEEQVNDKLKKLRETLKKCEAERMEYLTGWQRARADYINLTREHNESRKNFGVYADEAFFNDLLPVLDSFSMAFSNKEAWERAPKEWRTGVEYIHWQLLKALENHHIVEFIAKKGDEFDPNTHESVGTVPVNDKELDHAVIEIVKNGYKMGERVLRPAQVKLGELN